MRVGLLGRTSWLLNTAHRLIESPHELAFIATAAASPEYAVNEDDFEAFAASCDRPFRLVDRETRSALDELIRETRSDVILSVNWPWILSEGTCAIPRLGILNAHPGDLPRYRGNACPNWAIVNGEPHIGLCIHKMVPNEVDSGPIFFRAHLENCPDLYIQNVNQWLDRIIPEGFLAALDRLQDQDYQPCNQMETKTRPLRCHPRRPSDGEIDWRGSAEQIQRLVRASSAPFAGAFSYFEGGFRVTIWRARVAHVDHDLCAVPGQIAGRADDGAVRVVCGQGVLELEQVETEDGSRLSASNKYRLGPRVPQSA